MKAIKVLIAAMVLFAAQAHAGFFTGVFVGAAMSDGSSGQGATGRSTVIVSDQYDVIACRTSTYRNAGMCEFEGGFMTPQEFAKRAGYKTVHKVGTMMAGRHNHDMFLVLEVSK